MSTWQKPPLGAQPVIHPDGFISDWVMNEGSGNRIYDSSGNGNTGTLVGDTRFVPGRVGPALSLDGAGDYVDCGTIDMSSWLAVSQVVWAKTTGDDCLTSHTHSNNDDILFYFDSGGDLEIRFDDGTPSVVNAGTGFSDGEWHQYAYTFDGTTARLYVDGRVEGSGVVSFTFSTATDNALWIGRREVNATLDIIGDIDSVQVYNRALTSGEIHQLYIDSWWYFRHDPIELWAAAAMAGAAPAGIVPPSSGILRGVQRGILKGVA